MTARHTATMVSDCAWTLALLLAFAVAVWLLVNHPWVLAAWLLANIAVAPVAVGFILEGKGGEE